MHTDISTQRVGGSPSPLEKVAGSMACSWSVVVVVVVPPVPVVVVVVVPEGADSVTVAGAEEVVPHALVAASTYRAALAPTSPVTFVKVVDSLVASGDWPPPAVCAVHW